MKHRAMLFVMMGLATSVSVLSAALADDVSDEIVFEIDGYPVIVNSSHVADILLDWDSDYLPSAQILFDSPINTTLKLHIPKNMPRTVNLDFGSSLYVTYPEPQYKPILETESDCFYILDIIVKNADRIEIGSGSVAAGRWEPVTVENKECAAVYDELSSKNGNVIPLREGHTLHDASPLKQSLSGIQVEDIRCRETLILMARHDGSPACVTQSTAPELSERGWGWVLELEKESKGEFIFSFCGGDGFDSQGNLNKNNSTHHWDENECAWGEK